MSDTILAWHFVGDTLRDGTPVPSDGETIRVEGKIVLCQHGLHASERVTDALRYAPGPVICRVEVSGTMVWSDDKLAASSRTILWRLDRETSVRVLWEFARWCALSVAHLWDMPAVVREYLETGDETKCNAANAAANAAGYAAGTTYAAAQECKLLELIEVART